MSSPDTPDPVDKREAGVIEASFLRLSREPDFRQIVRLFQSRHSEKKDPLPLEAVVNETFWRIVRRDVGA